MDFFNLYNALAYRASNRILPNINAPIPFVPAIVVWGQPHWGLARSDYAHCLYHFETFSPSLDFTAFIANVDDVWLGRALGIKEVNDTVLVAKTPPPISAQNEFINQIEKVCANHLPLWVSDNENGYAIAKVLDGNETLEQVVIEWNLEYADRHC